MAHADGPRRGQERAKVAAAKGLEARENQLISLAVNLAEKQLAEGTASSQVITHYLKLGSTKDKLEKEILESKKELLTAKTDAIKSTQKSEALYQEALDAMKLYGGQS